MGGEGEWWVGDFFRHYRVLEEWDADGKSARQNILQVPLRYFAQS